MYKITASLFVLLIIQGCATSPVLPEFEPTHPAHAQAESATMPRIPLDLDETDPVISRPRLPISETPMDEMDHPMSHEHGEGMPEEGTYACAIHPKVVSAAAGQCSLCGLPLIPTSEQRIHGHRDGAEQDSMKEETEYSCSMHPNISANRPGTCPICGMELVKKGAGAF